MDTNKQKLLNTDGADNTDFRGFFIFCFILQTQSVTIRPIRVSRVQKELPNGSNHDQRMKVL